MHVSFNTLIKYATKLVNNLQHKVDIYLLGRYLPKLQKFMGKDQTCIPTIRKQKTTSSINELLSIPLEIITLNEQIIIIIVVDNQINK